jgi:hypothetical protein
MPRGTQPILTETGCRTVNRQPIASAFGDGAAAPAVGPACQTGMPTAAVRDGRD